MPGNSTNLQTHLPDQKVVVESLKSDQWPPPQLATIRNHTITLVNNSKQPVFLMEKKATSIKISPAPVTDTRQITHTQFQLNAIKPRDKLKSNPTCWPNLTNFHPPLRTPLDCTLHILLPDLPLNYMSPAASPLPCCPFLQHRGESEIEFYQRVSNRSIYSRSNSTSTSYIPTELSELLSRRLGF